MVFKHFLILMYFGCKYLNDLLLNKFHKQIKNISLKKFNFYKPNRVVIVCEEKSVKDSVIQILQKTDVFDTFHNFFIFKTNDELKEDFFNNWTLINREQVSFIQKSNSDLTNNEVI